MRVVNLSSRPFVNERPVVRLSIALWALGGLLAAVNIYSYSIYWYDSEEIRGEVAAVRKQIDQQEKDLAELTGKASAVDVQGLNDHAVFLNNLIRYRTFPWSRLFDDLEEVLPKDARLVSVQPQVEHQQDVKTTRPTVHRTTRSSRRRSSRETPPPPPPVAATKPDNVQEIPMALHGYAKSDEVILDFVDILFDHPSFRDPDFQRESQNEGTSEVSFDISVIYLLERPVGDDGGTARVAESEGEPAGAEAAEPEDQTDTAVVRKTFTGDETAADETAADETRTEELRAGGPRAGAPPPPRAALELADEDASGSAGAEGVDTGGRSPAVDGRRKPAVAPPGVEHDRLFRRATAGAPVPPVIRGAFPAVPGEPPPEPAEPPPPGGRPEGVTPTRPTPRPSPGAAHEGPDEEEAQPRLRPRFVEPNASGPATVPPGGGGEELER